MPLGMFILLLLIFLLKWICQAQFSSNEENIEEECPAEDHVQSVSLIPRSAFLWSIDASWRRAPSFMFGTIHVPFDRVWPNVPNSVKEAFDSADSIVFELALEKSETVEQLIKCKQFAPGDGSLRDHLPIELFHRLKAYMHRLRHRILRLGYQEHRSRSSARRQMRRLFPNDWEYRRPVWLLFLLFQLSDSPPKLQQKTTSPMLDLFLAQMAAERGKTLLSMETVEEQCNPLKSVNAQQIIFAINYSLGYLEWIEARGQGGNQQMIEDKSPIDKLVQHYRCGTFGNGLKQIIFGAHRFAQNGFSASPEEDQLARKVDNLLIEDILFRRNERMAKRVDALMREQPNQVFFFALGAGHFLGHESLIGQLQQMGHWVAPIVETPNSNVQYLNFDGKLPSNNQPKSILLFPASRVANMALPKIGIRFRELVAFNSATNSMINCWYSTMMEMSFLVFILGSSFCYFSFIHCCNLS